MENHSLCYMGYGWWGLEGVGAIGFAEGCKPLMFLGIEKKMAFPVLKFTK